MASHSYFLFSFLIHLVMWRYILSLLLLVAFSTSLMAQITLTADISYSNSNYQFTKGTVSAFNSDLPKGFEVSFAPRVGVVCTDNVEVGVQLGFSYSDYAYTSGLYDPIALGWNPSHVDRPTSFTYSAGLYLRYCCMQWGKMALSLEMRGIYGFRKGLVYITEYSASYETAIESHVETQAHQIDLYLLPVLTYRFSNHFSMDINLNLATLSYSHSVETQWMPRRIYYGEPLVDTHTETSQFGVGLNGLTTALLSLGFGYTF